MIEGSLQSMAARWWAEPVRDDKLQYANGLVLP